MPNLEVAVENFTPPVPDAIISVSFAALCKAAAFVGTPAPFRWPGAKRSLREMIWRVAMATSNLGAVDGNWVRSNSYDALDGSEKGAVSFFLGGVQAQITSQQVLGYSHLVHVDALLEGAGLPRAGTRPDFLAIDARTLARQATVEAKGRTHGYDATLLANAKAQARAVLPAAITFGAVPEHVVSVSWFDRHGVWNSLLHDPPATGSPTELHVEDVLHAYYRPVIAAGRQAGTLRFVDEFASMQFEEVGFALHLPSAIAEACDERVTSGPESTPILDAYRSFLEAHPESPLDLVVATLLDTKGAHQESDSSDLQRDPESQRHTVRPTSDGVFAWASQAPVGLPQEFSSMGNILTALFENSTQLAGLDITFSEIVDD